MILLLVPSACLIAASGSMLEKDCHSALLLTELSGSKAYNAAGLNSHLPESRALTCKLGCRIWGIRRQCFQKHWSGRGTQRRRAKQFRCGVKAGGVGNTLGEETQTVNKQGRADRDQVMWMARSVATEHTRSQQGLLSLCPETKTFH